VEVREGAAKKDYTVRLADAKGLVSGILNASTKPNKAEAEKVDITKGNIFGSGSGSSEGDPVIIACDSTGAELKVSSATAGVTVHGTLTDTGTAESTQYNGNPITVPLPLNGAGEKTYKLEYYTDGEGFARTDVKTVYYKILKGHTVTFDANGGSYPDGTTAVSKHVLYGSTVSEPDPLPVKQGYYLPGWYRTADGSGQAWNFAADTVTNDITLYAGWAAGEGTKYKVEHYRQNIADDNYELADTENKTGTTEGKAGYSPKTGAEAYPGCEYDSTLTRINGVVQTTGSINADGSTVVQLYYKRKTYTVNFSVVDGLGGTISAAVTGGSVTSTSSASVKHGGSVTFTATPGTGYAVAGWTVSPGSFTSGANIDQSATLSNVTAGATVTVKFFENTINGAAGPNEAWKKLRKAVNEAPAGGTIVINGEIKATNDADNNGEILVNKNLTIKPKNNAGVLDANKKADGKPAHRIFKVDGVTLTLKDLTLTGGIAETSGDALGGGISVTNGGKLTLNNTKITDCRADYGGAVLVDGSSSSVTMESGSLTANTATSLGGAVSVEHGASFTMTGGEITGNTGKLGGGGAYVHEGTFTLGTSASIKSNIAEGSNGGGVYVDTYGTLNINGGFIQSNEATQSGSAVGNGGGVYVFGNTGDKGKVIMTAGTIGGDSASDGNTAGFDGGVYRGVGGGVYSEGGTFEISSGEIKSN
ncbi:repeat protein, partial [Treponema vincentii ATCC 35580]